MDREFFAILTLLAYSAIALGLVVRSIRRHHGWGVWLLYAIERSYVPLMFHWRATNRPCPLPAEGGGIIMANHRSPVDPLFVWMNHHLRADGRQIRVIGFLTAREYCNVPGLRWLVRTMQSIPVNRDGQDALATREAIRRLKAGRLVGIFPEGGLNFNHNLREANPGIAFLALKARVPVYPIYISGSPQHGTSMVAPFTRRCRVQVTYGQPVDLSPYFDRKTSPELLVEVTNLLMSRLASLGGVGFSPIRLTTRVEAVASVTSVAGSLPLPPIQESV